MNYVSFSKFQDCVILEFDTDVSAGFLKNPNSSKFSYISLYKYTLYFIYSFSVFCFMPTKNEIYEIYENINLAKIMRHK